MDNNRKKLKMFFDFEDWELDEIEDEMLMEDL